MRIDQSMLACLVLLACCCCAFAQGPSFTTPDQGNTLAEPPLRRLPPTANTSSGVAAAAHFPAASLAPTAVPLPGSAAGAGDYQAALEASGWCEEGINAPRCCNWFGSLSTLIMTRSTKGDRFWSSSDSVNGALVQNSDQAEAGWTAGFEIQIGRRACDGAAWEITYWNLSSLDGEHSARSFATPGQLNTPLDVSLVTFNGVSASDYFNGAHLHQLNRYDCAQNLELNLWQAPVPVGEGRWRLNCLGGVRWLQFNDQLIFGSVSGGGGTVAPAGNFGDNGGASAAYLDVETQNNLVGLQLGSQAEYSWRGGLSFFCIPRVGLYANFMNQTTRVYTGDGIYGYAAPVGGVAAYYPLETTKTDVAVLTQIDAGARWKFAPHWQSSVAYRIVGAGGVALADSQIPAALANYPAFAHIESGGGLVLQGIVLSLEFNY